MPPRTLTSDRSTAPRRSARGTTRDSGPTTIALANQKGGVAKTTSVASIGAALAELGRRVLLVDLDPQACLTFSLGVDPDTVERSIHDVLTGRAEVGDVVVTCEEGLDLVPSTIDLAGAEAMLLPRPGREYILNRDLEFWGILPTLFDGRSNHAREVLADVGERYDLPVLEPPIPKTVRFAEAPAVGRSILTTARSSKGAQAYRDVAMSLLARL